ncbi:MAG: ester cyclase [Caldilineaceae bacterium]
MPKAIITRYFTEVWNNRQFALFDQLLAPTVVGHERNAPDVHGIAEMRQLADTFFARFPDAQFTILDLVAEQNTVMVHLRVQATHAATGRAIMVTGMELLRIANGQISETWSNWDELGLFQQIGGRVVFDPPSA